MTHRIFFFACIHPLNLSDVLENTLSISVEGFLTFSSYTLLISRKSAPRTTDNSGRCHNDPKLKLRLLKVHLTPKYFLV